MQYDTIMGMLFYEFQNILETYSNILEERREAEEKENEKNGFDTSKYSPDKMMRSAQNYIPKSPISNMSQMPKIDIPYH